MRTCRKLVLAVAAVAVAWSGVAGTAHAQTGTIWSWKDGYFRRTGDRAWSEYQQGKLVFTFKETYKDNDELHLYDASRGFTVKIRGGKAEIWSGTDLLGAHAGRWVWQGWRGANNKNHFIHVGDKKWEERQNGKAAFTFRETYRTAEEIHLHDASRGFTVKLYKDQNTIWSGTDLIGKFPGAWSE